MAIITVSREMGTGAYQIASEVAQRLKYTLIDGPRINSLAAKYGLTPEMLQMVDEKPPSYVTAEDRKRAAALNSIELIILDLARKGNVVIYGRGGQDLLKDCKTFSASDLLQISKNGWSGLPSGSGLIPIWPAR